MKQIKLETPGESAMLVIDGTVVIKITLNCTYEDASVDIEVDTIEAIKNLANEHLENCKRSN